ncbi:hypothetical protein LINGRAHAP2_LOCUS20893 [Linum grandiflorum]
MGNNKAMKVEEPQKKEKKAGTLVKVAPPVDPAYTKWLARYLERNHGFKPDDVGAVKPPDHYVEYMQLHGWLDVSLDDPDLAHLFPGK